MPCVLPRRSKTFSLFHDADGALCASGHATKKVTKIKNNKLWILKDFGVQDAFLPQIEAGVAGLYRLIKPRHIPKVRVVHKPDSITTEPRFYATVSQEFPNFLDLQSYLGPEFGSPSYEAKDKVSIDFLVENGFAEICALSYFFEEDDFHLKNVGISEGYVVRIDFDMSAYSLVKKIRGERLIAGSAEFPITAHDLSHFPCIKDATPFYWPTTYQLLSGPRGYTGRAVELFSLLEKNEKFRAKSYAAFLKIVCTPDAAMRATLKSHIADEAEAEKVTMHFVARKKELKEKLLTCPIFKKWWENALAVEIGSLFDDVKVHNDELKKSKYDHLHIDRSMVNDAYRAFSYDMIKEKLEGVYVLLNNLVSRVPCPKIGEFGQQNKNFVYTMLNVFQKNIFKVYQECSDCRFLDSNKVNEFIQSTQNLLVGLETVSKMFPSNTAAELEPFFTDMRACLDQLQRDDVATLKETSDAKIKECMAEQCHSQNTCYVMHATALDYASLMQDMVAWLRNPKNLSTIADMFKNACMEYEKVNSTLLTNTYSGVCSAVGYACSWWKPSVPVVVAADIVTPELREMYSEMSVATPDSVCHAISKMLCDSSLSSIAVSEKFMLHLIAAFSQEFSANHIVDQLQKNPHFAEYLKAQPDNRVGMAQAREIASYLKRELEPGSEELLADDGFVEVQHNSVGTFLVPGNC